MDILTIILYCLVGIGLFFNIIGILGLLRFPDVYTRLHAETKTTTFGSIFLAIAIAVYAFVSYFGAKDPAMLSLGVHVLIAIIVLGFTNATGSHALAHAAYTRGQKPELAVVDKLQDLNKASEDGEA